MSTNLRPLSAAAALLLVFAMFGCAGSERVDGPAVIQPDQGSGSGPDSGLPALDDLPSGQGIALRSTSAATYELLDSAPIASSPGSSAIYSAGSLSLDPAQNDGLAWAIFEIFEFLPGGTVVPQKVLSSPNSGYWIAASNFSKNRWRSIEKKSSAAIVLNPAIDWTSPSGSVFIAVVVSSGPLDLTSLMLETNEPLVNAGLDEVEDNDTVPTANPLPALPFTGFDGNVGSGGYDGDKDDFLSFEASDGLQVDITMTYDGTDGNLKLTLFNSGTQTVLVEDAAGNTGTRRLVIGLKAGTYVMRVQQVSGAATYSIGISQSTPELDEIEDNDTIVQANELLAASESTYLGHIGSGGYDGDKSDYYVLDAQKGEVVTASLIYQQAEGNAFLRITDAAGQQLAVSNSGNPGNRQLTLGLHEGLNHIHVQGDFGGTDYTLIVERSEPGYDESEHNDNFTTANPLSEPVVAWMGSVGSSGYDGDLKDYYALPTNAGDIVDLELSYSAGNGNLKLVFIYPDQTNAYTDSAGNSGSRSFSWGARQGVSYILVEAVSGYSDYELGVTVSSPGYDELENNDGHLTAQVLPGLPVVDFFGSIGPFGYDGDNADVFGFTADEGDVFTLSLNYDPLDDNVFLELLNGSGQRMYIDNTGNSGNRQFNWGLKAGGHFVKVSGNGSHANYLLSVSKINPGYDELEDNDTRQTAKPLAQPPFTDFSGHVGSFGYNGGNNDYHFFNLDETTALVFDMSYDPVGGVLLLYLLDGTGAIVEEDTASNPGTRQISTTVNAGTYYLRVQATSGNSDYSVDAAIVP